MINIDWNNLNEFEKQIHALLNEFAKQNKKITITEAATFCQCSPSKISKLVKKLGFINFKQYLQFIYGKKVDLGKKTTTITALKHFLDNFNYQLIDDLTQKIKNHDTIILFGHGPSFICAEYFEYKLRIATDKTVLALQDEISLHNSLRTNCLLLIFSVTAEFATFTHISQLAKEKNVNFILIVEEYKPELAKIYENIIFLSDRTQSSALRPYEKSRAIFFITVEEIVAQLLNEAKNDQ